MLCGWYFLFWWSICFSPYSHLPILTLAKDPYYISNLPPPFQSCALHPNTILDGVCWSRSSQKSMETDHESVYKGFSGSLITNMTSRFSAHVSGSGGRGLKIWFVFICSKLVILRGNRMRGARNAHRYFSRAFPEAVSVACGGRGLKIWFLLFVLN
jgi:hypothetical protein